MAAGGGRHRHRHPAQMFNRFYRTGRSQAAGCRLKLSHCPAPPRRLDHSPAPPASGAGSCELPVPVNLLHCIWPILSGCEGAVRTPVCCSSARIDRDRQPTEVELGWRRMVDALLSRDGTKAASPFPGLTLKETLAGLLASAWLGLCGNVLAWRTATWSSHGRVDGVDTVQVPFAITPRLSERRRTI